MRVLYDDAVKGIVGSKPVSEVYAGGRVPLYRQVGTEQSGIFYPIEVFAVKGVLLSVIDYSDVVSDVIDVGFLVIDSVICRKFCFPA